MNKKNKFTTKDINNLKSALGRAGAIPIKFKPVYEVDTFLGYNIYQLKQIINFAKSKNFKPKQKDE